MYQVCRVIYDSIFTKSFDGGLEFMSVFIRRAMAYIPLRGKVLIIVAGYGSSVFISLSSNKKQKSFVCERHEAIICTI